MAGSESATGACAVAPSALTAQRLFFKKKKNPTLFKEGTRLVFIFSLITAPVFLFASFDWIAVSLGLFGFTI